MSKKRDVFNNLDKFSFLKEDIPGSLIFTDIDGTISSIAKTPGGAYVGKSIREALELVNALFRVAVVSGRPLDEAKEMVGLEDLTYLANHGLDSLIDGKVTIKESKADRGVIEDAIATLKTSGALEDGMTFEDKGLSLAIHYRLTNDNARSETMLKDLLSPLAKKHNMTLLMGRMVIELKSKKSNKGEAVLTTIERFGSRNAIYIGDDTTDVDAFKVIAGLRDRNLIKGFSIGVLSDETHEEVINESDFFLRSVDGVESFLRWLSLV